MKTRCAWCSQSRGQESGESPSRQPRISSSLGSLSPSRPPGHQVKSARRPDGRGFRAGPAGWKDRRARVHGISQWVSPTAHKGHVSPPLQDTKASSLSLTHGPCSGRDTGHRAVTALSLRRNEEHVPMDTGPEARLRSHCRGNAAPCHAASSRPRDVSRQTAVRDVSSKRSSGCKQLARNLSDAHLALWSFSGELGGKWGRCTGGSVADAV